jgi:Na+-driven multidrug efflux pump
MKNEASHFIFQGLFISILIGLPFSVGSIVFDNPLLAMVGANEQLKNTAFVYFKGFRLNLFIA